MEATRKKKINGGRSHSPDKREQRIPTTEKFRAQITWRLNRLVARINKKPPTFTYKNLLELRKMTEYSGDAKLLLDVLVETEAAFLKSIEPVTVDATENTTEFKQKGPARTRKIDHQFVSKAMSKVDARRYLAIIEAKKKS